MAFFGHKLQIESLYQQRQSPLFMSIFCCFINSNIYSFPFSSLKHALWFSLSFSLSLSTLNFPLKLLVRVSPWMCVWNSVLCVRVSFLCWNCSKTLILYAAVSFRRTHSIEWERETGWLSWHHTDYSSYIVKSTLESFQLAQSACALYISSVLDPLRWIFIHRKKFHSFQFIYWKIAQKYYLSFVNFVIWLKTNCLLWIRKRRKSKIKFEWKRIVIKSW